MAASNERTQFGDISPPDSAATATVQHRVAFYETDAMGIVHHSNYVRFFEHARVSWLEQYGVGGAAGWSRRDREGGARRCDVDRRRAGGGAVPDGVRGICLALAASTVVACSVPRWPVDAPMSSPYVRKIMHLYRTKSF